MTPPSPLVREFWACGASESCPIIDMHGHMGLFRGIYFPRCSTDAMIHTMDQCGVRMLLFAHHEALFCPEIGNSSAIAAVRKYPSRLRAYLSVNPNYPQAVEQDLAAYDDNRDIYAGLKILAGYHGVPWDAPAYEKAWRFANQRKLLVLGHTWQDSPFDGPAKVRKIAQQYPDIRLMCGHSLYGNWDQAISLALEFPNLYLELTAVLCLRGPLERFCAAGLSHKLLFGVDLPWFDPHQGIGTILSAAISDDDRRNILYRNAQRLLIDAGIISQPLAL